MSKFTPGPWEAAARKGDDWDSVVFVQNNPNLEVCQCFHASRSLAALDRCEATTHLIAAAPEMYEALHAINAINELQGDCCTGTEFEAVCETCAAMKLLKAALAKADGGQQ